MIKNEKIIVTGSNGFVGRHLSGYLRKKGIPVIDRNNRGDCLLDVTDLRQLLSICDNVAAIIHLAAKTSVNNSSLSPHETYYTNLLGTLNLLEFARQKKVTKFINVSTYVYGQPRYLPVDESHPIDPGSPYNKSKLLAEDLCRFYSNDFEINVVTLRPFYIYGSLPRPNSFIYNVLEQIAKKTGIVTISGESTKRDFLFINDFLHLIEIVLDKFPRGYNLYNVGSGQGYTLTEVARILAKLLGVEISIQYDSQMRTKDVTDMVADISKVNHEFDWSPSTSLNQGLQYTVEHYLSSIKER